MTDLRELEKRLEEATGPDRELDCLIWGRDRGLEITWQNDCMIAQGEGAIGWIDPGKHQRNFSTNRSEHGPGSIPAYTASLDAAVALVERVLPSNRDDGRAWLQLLADAVTTALISDAKPEDMARLVCINIIRALIAKGDRHD